MVQGYRGAWSVYWVIFLAALAFGCAEDDVVGQADDLIDPVVPPPLNGGGFDSPNSPDDPHRLRGW